LKKQLEVLAIIPARGGSKEVPNKNIRKIAGKALIEYTISAAKKSKKINKIIVSTDCEKIAKISKKAGVEIPFLRPKKISRDTSPAIDYVKHALEFLDRNENYSPEIVIILQPTSPHRKSEIIDKSIQMLTNSKATCVMTVTKTKSHPYLSFWYSKNYLKPFKQDFQKYYQRQRFPELYYPTGSVYTFWKSNLMKYQSIYGPKIKPLMLNDEDSLDVDSPFDFFMNEMRIKFWEKYKRNFTK